MSEPYWVEQLTDTNWAVLRDYTEGALYICPTEAAAKYECERANLAYAAGLAARDAEVARWKKCCEDMAPAETVRALNAEVERLTRRVQELEAALRWYMDRAGDPITRDTLHREASRRFLRALSGAAPTEGGTK